MKVIHEHGYWLDDSREGHYFDAALSRCLLDLCNSKTVLDLGCGVGAYVEYLRKHGTTAIGFDGNPHTNTWSQFCYQADLTKPLNHPVDFVLSLETGEHIPEPFQSAFLDNCCNNAGELLVISWALPGQGGKGHFNERENSWVISEVTSRQFEFCKDLTLDLRRGATIPWLQQTTMAFRRRRLT